MKFERLPTNNTEMTLSNEELRELAYLIQRGLESLEEYNDLKCLEVHDKQYYKDTTQIMIFLANANFNEKGELL